MALVALSATMWHTDITARPAVLNRRSSQDSVSPPAAAKGRGTFREHSLLSGKMAIVRSLPTCMHQACTRSGAGIASASAPQTGTAPRRVILLNESFVLGAAWRAGRSHMRTEPKSADGNETFRS